MMQWEILFFVLLACAILTFWLARRSRTTSGLPAGRLVYSDTTHWRPVERPLFSRAHRLTGRPDYLVEYRHELVPVEVKSGRPSKDGPYPSHVLQLAAYCLLVEETHGRRPPYGIILYTGESKTSYEIDYTPALERRLLDTLDQMRDALAAGDARRSHHHAARCHACGYRSDCNQSLAGR
jgi:CRISPR-associated exonuclease Cas4